MRSGILGPKNPKSSTTKTNIWHCSSGFVQPQGGWFLLHALRSPVRASVPLTGPFQLSSCRSQSPGFYCIGPLGVINSIHANTFTPFTRIVATKRQLQSSDLLIIALWFSQLLQQPGPCCNLQAPFTNTGLPLTISVAKLSLLAIRFVLDGVRIGNALTLRKTQPAKNTGVSGHACEAPGPLQESFGPFGPRVSRGVSPRVSLKTVSKCSAFGPRAPECPKSVPRVSPECPVWILWGHSQDTF